MFDFHMFRQEHGEVTFTMCELNDKFVAFCTKEGYCAWMVMTNDLMTQDYIVRCHAGQTPRTGFKPRREAEDND